MDKHERQQQSSNYQDQQSVRHGPDNHSSKGKEKETATTATAEAYGGTSSNGTVTQSLGSRIVTSASRLANDLVTNRANASASEISKTVIPRDKARWIGTSSSSGGGVDVSDSVYGSHLSGGGGGGPSSSSSSAQGIGETNNRFRSADTQNHVAQQEAAFSSFLDGISALKPPQSMTPAAAESQDTLYHHDSYKGDQQAQHGRENTAAVPPTTTFGSAGTRSEDPAPIQDGLEVVQLLESGAYDEAMAETVEEPTLSPEERASLRRALFSTEHSNIADSDDQAIDWTNLLNFLPSYVVSDGHGHNAQALHPLGGTHPEHERSGHLGTADARESQKIWAGQWQDVLTRYNDEVWGDLGSLVSEARREMQEAESQGPVSGAAASDFPALRRLQQILGQIRGF